MIEMKDSNKVVIEFEIDSTWKILINLSIWISALLFIGKIIGLHDGNIIFILCPIWMPLSCVGLYIYFKIIIHSTRVKK